MVLAENVWSYYWWNETLVCYHKFWKMIGQILIFHLHRLKALGKAAQHLWNAGTLFNKVDTNLIEIEQLKENLTTYIDISFIFPNIN